ncbi:zinc transporter [Citrus sinensis]|nr:zinc transporter [Citrus sinensis]
MVPSVINGGITALYFILWGKGLKSCGPVRALLAEYSGAVLGVLSAVLYGRRGHVWKKVGGLIAILASFYFLSQGWLRTEQVLGMKEMVVPLLAGILSALRRVIARRVSLKNTLKRRLHAITITSATCFLFPVAMWDLIIGSKSSSSVDLPFSAWAFLSTTLFGIILIFYVDAMAEERLHMVFSSPRHLMVAGGCIIVMEMVYKMDFSLIGFIICSLILGFGIYEATSLDHGRKDTFQKPDLSNGMLGDELQMSSLPT